MGRFATLGLSVVVLALVAGLSYGQLPLYSSNQNQYFLHGLARAGLGNLKDDWFIQTADYTPVFSFLVMVIHRYTHDNVFYVLHFLLVALYVYSLVGILHVLFGSPASRARRWVFLAVIVVMHSVALATFAASLVGANLRVLLTDGVALQSIPGTMFQPNLFGVLLVWSLYMFLRGRVSLAGLGTGLAAFVHPTYLFGAAILTASYMWVTLRQSGDIRRVVTMGVLPLVLVLPILAYVYINFRGPIDHEVASYVMNRRASHHLLVGRWLGPVAYGKLGLVLVGMYLVKRTPLLIPMLVSLVAASGLTLAYVLTGSWTLGAMFPWRLSVYLVPVSSSIIVGFIVSKVLALRLGIVRSERALAAIAACLMVASSLGGLMYMREEFRRHASVPGREMFRFVAEHKGKGDVYFIPVSLEEFRLRTGAPIFIDRKALPLRDTDVAEWYSRLQLATSFYEANGAAACTILYSITQRYVVSHVVLANSVEAVSMQCLTKVYQDSVYGVYKIRSSSALTGPTLHKTGKEGINLLRGANGG